MANQVLKLVGSPMECGAQVWEHLCLPTVHAASKQPRMQLAQFYAGILSAAFGSMAADFGHERATEIAQTMVDAFAGMQAELPGSNLQ